VTAADTSGVTDAPETPPPLEELVEQERSLSAARRRLHDVIDFMRTLAPAARSPQGEQLRHLEGKERELSQRRRSLQGLIDAISGRGGR
jgi:hypothetical protein